jgi:multiple sugar transport system permease protein
MTHDVGHSRFWRIARYGFTFFVVLAAAFPLYWLVITSLKGQGEVATNPPVYFPSEITFENYQAVLAQAGLPGNIVNSLIVAISSTIITVVIGAMAAYALARRQLPHNFRHWLLIAVLVIRMFPPITTVIPYFVLLRGFGLTDTYVGLVLTYVAYGLPFAIWILVGFFQELPHEIEEAATMDGTSYLQRFRLIVLPLARPALAVTAVFVLIYAWNEFLFASILTSFNSKTLPVVMAGYISDRGIEWGQMTALGTMMVIPVIIVAWLSQKHIVRGLTFGAVKE